MPATPVRRFHKVSGGLLIFSAFSNASAAPAAPNTRYAISTLVSSIPLVRKVGNIKQGFICAPKGALKFGQLQRMDQSHLQRRIADLAATHGHQIDLDDVRFPSASRTATHVLVGSLETISLDLCVPGANIGIGSRKSKGGGTMVVTWEVWRQADKTLSAKRVMEIPFDVRGIDPRVSSDVIEDYLAQSAVQFLDGTVGQRSE